MHKFIRDHFDKLILLFIWLLLYAGFYITGNADFLQLLRDVTVAIFAVVGARKLQDAANSTNINDAQTVEVNQPKNESAPDEKKNDLSII